MKKQMSFAGLRVLIEAAGWALLLYAVQLLQLALFKQTGKNLFLSFCLLLLPALLCRLAWAAGKKFWQFVAGWCGAAVCSIVAALFLGGWMAAFWSGIACLAMLLLRLAPGLKLPEPGWIKLGLMAGVFIFSAHWRKRPHGRCLRSIRLCILKFLYDSLSATDGLISDMAEKAYLPQKQIRAVGGGMTALYLLLTAGIMLLFSLIPAGGFLAGLGGALKRFLRWLCSFFSFGEQQPVEIPPPENHFSQGSALMGENVEASWLAVLLQQIFLALAVVALVAIIIAVIAYIIYRFYKHFYEIPEGRTEQREFVLPFMKKDAAERENMRAPKAAGRDPAARIRRVYRKKLHARLPAKQKLSPALTPSEQVEQARLADIPEREGFRRLYEKARYSAEVSEEEAEKMRSMAERL
ncbi:MAG: hypothetical protein ACLSB9_12290 [Hydrogeniiclostridium mannosilyticum]